MLGTALLGYNYEILEAGLLLLLFFFLSSGCLKVWNRLVLVIATDLVRILRLLVSESEELVGGSSISHKVPEFIPILPGSLPLLAPRQRRIRLTLLLEARHFQLLFFLGGADK